MKKYFILFFIIVSCGINKNEKDDKLYSCNEICNIIDPNLYDTLSNGSYFIKPVFNDYKIYEVRCEENTFIITDSLKKILDNSIKRNNCKLRIKEIKSGDTIFSK
ncbi:hypothetical protein SAMN04488096_103295 [Mesonia phycicola]|uniref:Uncharacterized protein n=1 Tax=Mesonia phycicola TaxID=579105 RepID=A0A1M6D4U1_9FLAO|nr:hypothetical protein SAMN04488096_103295 [Mesonia phycicola]